MKKNWTLWISATLLIVIALISLFGSNLPFVDRKLEKKEYYKADDGSFHLAPFPPSKDYPLGSDHFGVDILSRIMVGAKETFLVVVSVIIVRYLIAIPLAIGGYYSRFISLLLNMWNQLFSFLPPIFFMSLIVGIPIIFFSGIRPALIVVVLAILEVGRAADITLAQLRETGKKAYVEAGIVSGCSPIKLFKTYYVPSLLPYITVLVINDIGRVLFLFAQLGIVQIFIDHKFVTNLSGGYDVVNASDSWPSIFSTIIDDIRDTYWIPFSVIGVIGLTIFSLNMFADGLQKFFEKKYRTFRADL